MAADDHPYIFTEPDAGLWDRYGRVAERAFGHPVRDVALLREVAVACVATRAGQVVAGGLALAVDQCFGGRSVPGACLGAGCVAPEERGNRLADLLMQQRLQVMRDRGAAVATLWTSSTGYVRHLGFEAPTTVHAWTVPTEDLRGSFDAGDFDVQHVDDQLGDDQLGDDQPADCVGRFDGLELQRRLAAEWNGPVLRPPWWWTWKQAKHQLRTYRFTQPGQPATAALVSLATSPRTPRGLHVVVHDLWATDQTATAAVLAFLGRHHSRAEAVQFRRAALPPHLGLLHGLRRFRLTSEAWHPWMLRLLDIPAALRARGWPLDADFELPIQVTGDRPRTYALHVRGGTAEVELVTTAPVTASPVTAAPAVRFTPGQMAAWYAGAYSSATAARLAGISSDHPAGLATLIRATTDLDPWLPDLF